MATQRQRTRGKVLVIDCIERQVVLTDGSEFWVDPPLPLDAFRSNRTIKITYDEEDGRRWARIVEPLD